MSTEIAAEARHSVQNASKRAGWRMTRPMLTAPSGPTATPNSTTIQGWGATLDRAGPGQPELFLGDDLVAIRPQARVGQLDDDAGALGLRGGERVRLAARDAQLVAVQEAAVVVVQPVAVAVGAGHLPVRRA
jgi:hypothetical protein